ncbi:MAG: leucine-rich repeat domain-containing protein [Clostridia bacterium]|nr:leucine-rich repeat domain-containing protein [Clostridia bacterium]
MKKIISFVLLLSIVACLAACSNDSVDGTEATSALTEASTVAETTVAVPTDIPRLVSGDYAFSVSNGEATVIEFVGDLTGRGRGYELVIPETVEGYPVVALGDYCFELSISLGSIKIPSGVTKIGVGAFKNCWKLDNVEIPDSVTTIEKSAFEECHILTSIDIPDSVTSIGEKALTSTYGLTVNCSVGSYAEEYAKANGINCVTE